MQQQTQASAQTTGVKRGRTEETTDTGSALKLQKSVATTGAVAPYLTSPDFARLLLSLKVERIPIPDNKIFIAQRTDKVTDVWRGLIRHNFLSVPVLQKTKQRWYGFVDMADIVLDIVRTFDRSRLVESKDFWELIEKEESFSSKVVNDIMTAPLTRRNPFHPVTRGYSLWTACEAMARERALHRIPVVDENRNLVNLITQSQMVKFLYENINMLGSIAQKPAGLVQDFDKDVYTVRESTQALDAFKLMVEKGVSGLAVVNDEGVLTGNISLRDLKGISHDASLFYRLFQDVKSFREKVQTIYGRKDNIPVAAVFARVEDTLENVIKMLSINNIHRVYVVDNQMKPMGVISLKDVLLQIVDNIGNPMGAQ